MAVRQDRFIDTTQTLVQFGDPSVAFQHKHKFSSLSEPQVLQLLTSERKANALYDTVWREAEGYFQQKKAALLNQGMPAVSNECHIAVIAYTLNTMVGGTKLYMDFNAKTRGLTNDASWAAFPYKSLYCLIMRCARGVNSRPVITTRAYRGVNFHYSQSSFKAGQEVSFNQFTSSSAKSQVADFFKGGKKGTVLEFSQGSTVAIGIEAYSPFAESEVLIFPWSKFRITSWDQSTNTHRIVLQRV